MAQGGTARSEFVLRDPHGKGEIRLFRVVLCPLCTCCDMPAQAHVSTQTKNKCTKRMNLRWIFRLQATERLQCCSELIDILILYRRCQSAWNYRCLPPYLTCFYNFFSNFHILLTPLIFVDVVWLGRVSFLALAPSTLPGFDPAPTVPASFVHVHHSITLFSCLLFI